MPGFPELAVILIVIVIVFGATKLPQFGEMLGRVLSRLLKHPNK